MSELFHFMDQHTFIAFCMICAVYYTIKLPFWILNRYFRSRNIRAHGWPPAPMDADGDIALPEKSP